MTENAQPGAEDVAAPRPIFPEWATAGYYRDSDEWLIDLDPPPEHQPATLNTFAIRMALTALDALGGRGRVREASYYAYVLDEQGRPRAWHESDPVPVGDGSRVVVQATLQELAVRDHLVYETLFLDCDLQVFLADPAGAVHELWVPYAATVHFGFYSEGDVYELQRLTPYSADIRFSTHINVWDARTPPWRDGGQDNTATARLNQPWLEAALRRCEQLVGKPIVEYGSYRYGVPPVDEQLR
jgi:hypothetical protein